MNKAQLVEIVAEKQGKTKKEVAELLDAILDEITAKLYNIEEVKISGFGNFKPKKLPKRVAVNPMTKLPIEVPAQKKVAFHPSEVLKEFLNK